MRYSKLGVDSLEYDEYVTYEVVTTDSTFRIPLAAIDSIGFVQPEIKFNPKARHMDFLGMTEYVTAADGTTLTFSSSMPAELQPKVGDVLLGFTGALAEQGFAGRATDVRNAGGSLVVTCEPLENMSDIFEQFISVEQIGTDEGGNQVKHRMAGYNQLKNKSRISSNGSSSLTLVDISLNSHIPFIPDLTETGGVHLNADINGAFRVKMCAMHQIQGRDYFFKVRLIEEYSIQIGTSMGIHGSDFKSVALIVPFSVKFPAACPIFEVRPAPELGVRYSGDFSAKVTFPAKSGSLHQTFIIDSDLQGITYQGNESDKQGGESQPTSLFDTIDGGMKLSGLVQFGVKQPCGIYTNGWFESIFAASMGMDIFLGPKLEASIEYSGRDLFSGNGAYTLRNNMFGFTPLSLDYEAYAEYTDAIMRPNKMKWTFADGSFSLFPKFEMYMFPSIDLKEAKYNPKKYQVETFMETDQHMVFFPSEIGTCLMDKDMTNIVISAYKSKLSFGDFAPANLEITLPTKELSPGKYKVMPVLRVLGGESPVKSLAKEVDIPPYLELSEDTINAGHKEKEYKIFFKSNTAHILATTALDWLKAVVTNTGAGTGTIDVTVEGSENLLEREGAIAISAIDDESGLITRDTLCVIQEAGGTIAQAHITFRLNSDNPGQGAGEYVIGDYPAIDVTTQWNDSVVTITGSKSFTEADWVGSARVSLQEGENSATSNVHFTLKVDMNNMVVLSGSATLSGETTCYREQHLTNVLDPDGPLRDIYEQIHNTTKVSVAFENVPRKYSGPAESCFEQGQITSASGTETYHSYSKDSLWDPEGSTEDKVTTITGGLNVTVRLFYASKED